MATCSACRCENPDTAPRCVSCGGLLRRPTRALTRPPSGVRDIAELARPVSAPATAPPSGAPATEGQPGTPQPPARRAPPPLPSQPAARRPGTHSGPSGPGRPPPPSTTRRHRIAEPPPPGEAGAAARHAETTAAQRPPRRDTSPTEPHGIPAGPRRPTRVPPPGAPPSARPASAPGTGAVAGWLSCHPFAPLALQRGATVRVGRTADADLTLPHPTVSRHQATLRVGAAGIELEDHSSHGTFVNGEPVQGVRRLAYGDVLTMGAYELELTRDPPAPGDGPTETTRRIDTSKVQEKAPEKATEKAAEKASEKPAEGPDVTVVRSNVFYGHYGAESSLLAEPAAGAAEEVVAGRPLPEDAPRLLRGVGGREYRLERELGRGAFGAVYLASIPGGARLPGFAQPVETAVVKLAAPSPSAQESLAREREVYACPDPGLVNLFDHGAVAEGPAAGRPFLVLERLWPHPFSRAGDQAVEPATAVDTFVNLLEVLHRLHTRREAPLVLCDIKPDNLMVRLSNKQGPIHAAEYARRVRGRAYEPVFMDMGCAQDRAVLAATGGRLKDVVGTPVYLPPEAIPRPDEARGFRPGVYSEKVDVFALTLTFYQLLTGDRPYAASGIWDLRGEELLVAILELKQQRGTSPWRAEVLRQRFAPADAQALEEVLAAGLEPSPELRLGARDLLRVCRRAFQVAEARVLSLSEYHFDAVQGIALEQRRFTQGSGS